MGLYSTLKSFFGFGQPGQVSGDSANNKQVIKAFGSGGYDGASSGRRMNGWNGSIQGPNQITLNTWEQLLRRSRDAIRNSALASSAIQRFESNHIGSGIVPHFNHPDEEIRLAIQAAWDKWALTADFAGQLSFYGLQGLLCRELFEAGECFVRYHVDEEDGFQLQLIESEQVPVYITFPGGLNNATDNTIIREGIIFDKASDKRIGYRLYAAQPYDSLINPMLATQFITLTTDDMIQVMKPLRAGALRGVPMMASVLPLLYDIEGYSDAERLRKRLSAAFAYFIQKPSIDDQVLPIDTISGQATPPGVDLSTLEPGTIQDLLPGETITAPQVPETGDYASFMYVELHKMASSLGMTYEQLTGDMKGVNYSSARVALLEIRRQVEMYQQRIIVDQFCRKILSRWMKEAVLSGDLELPDDYFSDPAQYESCNWISQGFPWIDPAKENQAWLQAVRSGFTSRTQVVREQGYDPVAIDNEQAVERQRAKDMGLIYDSDPNVVLIGHETVDPSMLNAKPDQDLDKEEDEDL